MKYKTFEDLKFNVHVIGNGLSARAQFANNYGVSVISTAYSYGGDMGLYELAVLDADGNLTYSTPVTGDVEGHLEEDDDTRLMKKVQDLPEIEPTGEDE